MEEQIRNDETWKEKFDKKESKRQPDMNKSELNRNIKWNFKKIMK